MYGVVLSPLCLVSFRTTHFHNPSNIPSPICLDEGPTSIDVEMLVSIVQNSYQSILDATTEPDPSHS